MSQNLERLNQLFAEIFQLDHAELDFGIYRIMNAKRDEITRFLDNDLLPQVREAFQAYEAENRVAVEAELAEAIEKAKELGADPETLPRVKERRAKLAKAVDVTALENEVYSHLYNFFRRYYSEGDFISQRRYKEGVYAIPYEGEEVKLYWANHDQYYIKTSEYLRNYTFMLSSGRRVHFKLVEANTDKDNNRPANGNERRVILSEEQPLAEEGGELVIRFEYRPDPEKRKQADLNTAAVDRILNQTTGFDHWRQELASPRPTEKNPNRTLLEKHLTDYTARNTFDYFIHKDLGGFLRRELDFYIKNEAQREEWVRLFAIDDIKGDLATPGYSTPLKPEFLKAYPTLVVDTRHFDEAFKLRLLAAIPDIDEETDGLLIRSENFQALNLLQERYKGQVECIYIDPPYNTGTDEFIYKDEYQTSSWLSSLRDRIMLAQSLLAENGIFFSSIDDNEESRLHTLLEDLFGAANVLPTVVIRRRKSQPNLRKGVAPVHDYLKIACSDYAAMARLSYVPEEFGVGAFSNPDNDPRGPWTTGPCSNRGGSRYKIVTPAGVEHDDEWRFTEETYKRLVEEQRIYFPDSGRGKPRYKIYLAEKKEQGVVASTWWDDVGDTQSSHRLLEELFGERAFENPKAVELLRRVVDVSTSANDVDHILDFFAGSGTTAHAVININREDGGRRKFILVEMGDY